MQLSSEHASNYNLRRNQVEGGLCTVECVVELLREGKCSEQVDGQADSLADELDGLFRQFIT